MNRGRVVIAGGSLGGLTAGLLLRDLGLDVTVHERSPAELEQRGAGIGFLPDSYRYLVERGAVELEEISVVTSRIQYLDRGGGVVHDQAHEYRFSSWNTVYRRLHGCFDRRRYHLGCEMTDFVHVGDVVRVQFADGAQRASVDADLLVCADGVSSPARRRLLPDVQPSYAGYVAWRGMTPEAGLDEYARALFGDAITYFVHANSHILLYPIPAADGSVRRGERLINFVWYRNYLEGGDLDDLMTDASGTRHEHSVPPGSVRADHVAEMQAAARARLPAVIADAVCAVPRPFVQVIYDVEVPRMAFGRVCLIGDAAWVVRPHAAAGTAKAAADGWALADAIAGHGDIPSALAAWESEQLALGRQLLDRTRRIGARSQVDCNWVPGDPELIFGLHGPGR
jgi:2,6-dihydroxypyridine 3-monooxygenase